MTTGNIGGAQRARRLSALTLALLLAALTLAGCSSGRSVQAYCSTFVEEGQKLRASFSGTDAADPFSALVQLLGAPQELAIMFKKLQKVSPDEIEPDVEVMQKAFQRISDDAVANGTNPMRGALEALMIGAATKGPTDRINAYTAKNCGPLPGADTAPSGSASDSADSDPSATPSPTPTRTGPPVAGDVLFDADRAVALCDGAVSIHDYSTNYTLKLLHRGIAAFDCGGTLKIQNLLTDSTLWQQDLSDVSSWDVTDEHLFTVTTEKVDADGLNPATTKSTITVYNMADGTKAWSSPLERWIAEEDRDPSEGVTVNEGISPDPDHPRSVVVGLQGTTRFDPSTGKELWHTKTRYNQKDDPDGLTGGQGTYIDDGVVVTVGEGPSGEQMLEGRNVKTGKRLWRVSPPASEGQYAGHCTNANRVEGTELWCGYDTWFEKVDVSTGKVVQRLVLPESACAQTSCWASPDGILAHDGKKLRYYVPGSATKPKWSVKATGSVQAAALGQGHLLLKADSGPVVLSTEDGTQVKTTSDMPLSDLGKTSVVDGLARMETEFDGAVVVLLDPPN